LLNAAALGAGAALGIVDHLRRRFARFELCAHLLDLLGLLFETRNDSLYPFLAKLKRSA